MQIHVTRTHESDNMVVSASASLNDSLAVDEVPDQHRKHARTRPHKV